MSTTPILLLLLLFATSCGNAFQNSSALLSYVNSIRALHNSRPLEYSLTLEAGAQAWATHMASINSLVHSTSNFGENLAEIPLSSTWKTAIDMWYAENVGYNYTSKTSFDPTRLHFTQLVWNSSSAIGIGVGVGVSTSANGFGTRVAFYVAWFSPPGNVLGYFLNNVFPPFQNPKLSPPTPPSRLSPCTCTCG